MKLSHVGFVLHRAVSKRGVVGTLTAAPAKIAGRLSRQVEAPRQFNPVHPFDAANGTDTSGLIAAEELKDSHQRRNIHNTGFYATSPSLFAQAAARLNIDHRRFTFVDLGAGKGRVMLMASQSPYKQVLGVELVPELQQIANRNVSVYQSPDRQCADVRCILGDVRNFVFPPVPLVIFLWHPFVGPVFEKVMQNLAESLHRDPRQVYVVYLKPQFEPMLKLIPTMKKLWEENLVMSDEDFAAYIFPDRSEVCVAYGTAG